MRREEVDMHIPLRRSCLPVPVELRFAYPQFMAGCDRGRQVSGLVRRVRHDHQYIDDGFCRQTGHGCRSDVFDAKRDLSGCCADLFRVSLVQLRLLVIVLVHDHCAFLTATDPSGLPRTMLAGQHIHPTGLG
jgi:hypothetical protein